MKKIFIFILLLFSLSASAFWNNNAWNGWNNNWNPYEVWDPRYWLEEMDQVWNDNNYYGGYYPNWNNYPPYGNNGYYPYNSYTPYSYNGYYPYQNINGPYKNN
ncbi:hypothetical protein MNB_SUP05-5-420 [hydrothermal vent metagenome]|uniref:Uncharacterized protein n=1 Tax=hydrothermal vent metagenome TaxID=652676 RepID=A0A1W1CLE6_9ZZZZ